MPPRLSALDASFLYLEQRDHTDARRCGVDLPPAAGRFRLRRLVDLIEQRIALVPRYRQKVRHVPGNLARPVWVDDPDFDVAYHVRRSALPKPGSDEQLTELVARLMSRPLDHTRPLWEMYLVEGLARGRTAVLTKTHQAMVDGISAIDIGQVILDVSRRTARGAPRSCGCRGRSRAASQLVLGAVAEAVARPGEIVDNARSAAGDAVATAGKVVGRGRRPVLDGPHGEPARPGHPAERRHLHPRRFADRPHRAGVLPQDPGRARLHASTTWCSAWCPGRCATGCSRAASRSPRRPRCGRWCRSRCAARLTSPARPRPARLGNRVSSFLVDLPVGEPSPVVRLHHVTHAMREHTSNGQSVGADTLVRIGGFAPPTLHALGARAASGISKRIFNLVVTNVPGPQFPLYAAGARMLEMFPVVPLAKGQALAIGLTSYDGGVFYGFNGDRDAMPDVDVLAGMVDESLDELARRRRAEHAGLRPGDLADAARRWSRPGCSTRSAAPRSRSPRSCASPTSAATRRSSSTRR